MATNQDVKKEEEVKVVDVERKIKLKKESKVTHLYPTQKTSEEICPISKYKEWKLLYTTNPLSNSSNPSTMTDSQIRSMAEDRDSGKYKGLCRNCRKHETCQIPKPEGGIWRCEDYD